MQERIRGNDQFRRRGRRQRTSMRQVWHRRWNECPMSRKHVIFCLCLCYSYRSLPDSPVSIIEKKEEKCKCGGEKETEKKLLLQNTHTFKSKSFTSNTNFALR
jgi:hypothetical protein